MTNLKVTEDLQQVLENCNSKTEIDVIIELNPPMQGIQGNGSSRAESVAQRKFVFNQMLQPIVAYINTIGGNVLNSAWINHTIKARVKKSYIDELAKINTVTTIDTLHQVYSE